jgi:hypothetical protein
MASGDVGFLEGMFGLKKPIIGMIHLTTPRHGDIVTQAVYEARVYADAGVNGVIVENYACRDMDIVRKAFRHIHGMGSGMVVGANFLPNEYESVIPEVGRFGEGFVQLDHVSGRYLQGEPLDGDLLAGLRRKFSRVGIFGGVWPKYYTPIEGSNLEDDLRMGVARSDAIVVTGQGTGMDTPLDQVKQFRKIIGVHPLIVGAGMNPGNVREQLEVADGAIVGSYFKINGIDLNPVDGERVREFMDVVRQVRRSV